MGWLGLHQPRYRASPLPGESAVTSSDACTEIRVAVLGDWVPSQLADVLALQRAEEPETTAALIECEATASIASTDGFDFVVTTTDLKWPGWICEPLWYDALAVAVAKRSHLLAHREVPCHEVLKQPIICAESTATEPWHSFAHRLVEDASRAHDQTVGTFDMAMTLVAAGYGIAIAPAARLAGYQCRGVAARPLAGEPPVIMAFLLRPCTALTEPQERFAQRARSVT